MSWFIDFSIFIAAELFIFVYLRIRDIRYSWNLMCRSRSESVLSSWGNEQYIRQSFPLTNEKKTHIISLSKKRTIKRKLLLTPADPFYPSPNSHINKFPKHTCSSIIFTISTKKEKNCIVFKYFLSGPGTRISPLRTQRFLPVTYGLYFIYMIFFYSDGKHSFSIDPMPQWMQKIYDTTKCVVKYRMDIIGWQTQNPFFFFLLEFYF